jgi:hypothetical protein
MLKSCATISNKLKMAGEPHFVANAAMPMDQQLLMYRQMLMEMMRIL